MKAYLNDSSCHYKSENNYFYAFVSSFTCVLAVTQIFTYGTIFDMISLKLLKVLKGNLEIFAQNKIK